jgi:transposase
MGLADWSAVGRYAGTVSALSDVSSVVFEVEQGRADGRAMRRYKRRWKVERLFGWIKRFRRVATRWDTISDNYLGFVQLAAAVIVLKRI